MKIEYELVVQMTGVIIKRKCEHCNSVVDQWAFFKEDEDGKIILEKWQEHCLLCNQPLQRPTEEELRSALLVSEQIAKNQYAMAQSVFALSTLVRALCETVTDANQKIDFLTKESGTTRHILSKLVDANILQTANLNRLIEGLNSLEKVSEALVEQSKSFKKSMDEHMNLLPCSTREYIRS